jgi:SPP1 family predicted phage head-tail adaptor
MDPGRLDRRITILQRGSTSDDWNQSANSYTTLATVWAEVREQGATEREEVDQTVTVATKLFIIRYRADITTLHRITYNSDTYDITGLAEVGRREGLRITAVARENS